MIRGALSLSRDDLVLVGVGGAGTLLCTAAVSVLGAPVGAAPLLLLVVLAGLVTAFAAVPHLALAGTIALFAVLPTLKALWFPWLGPVKELFVLSAVIAAVIVLIQGRTAAGRTSVDGWLAGGIGLLLVLYVLDVGGVFDRSGHDLAWAHGVRLFSQPFLLLLVGLTLPHARRNLRWAAGSLVVTTAAIGLYGVLQQLIGPYRLVELGYEWNVHVRYFAGRLRSFGTLDDPFAYAALLLFGLSAVLLWAERRALTAAAGIAIAAGLVVGYVRTSALITVAVLGLMLARGRRYTAAFALLCLSAGLSLVLLLGAQGGIQPRTVVAGSTGYLTLNGRTEAWEVALGDDPLDWLFGRGVGTVGTAANRATFSLTQSSAEASRNGVEAVDSGYFTIMADIGLIGLVVFLLLYARLLTLAGSAGRRGSGAGWLAVAVLTGLLLDAMTRDSFTGFPTAFVGLLVVGVALAAAKEEAQAQPDAAATT